MRKESSIKFFKHLGKSLKESVVGGKKSLKNIGSGNLMLAERQAASEAVPSLGKLLPNRLHRGRVKSVDSMKKKNLSKVEEVDDLLGVQMYSKEPANDIRKTMPLFDSAPKLKNMNKPGYKGVNIKGKYQGIPTEVQLSPGRLSNFGQVLQHPAMKGKRPANFTDWDVKASDRIGGYFAGKIPKE